MQAKGTPVCPGVGEMLTGFYLIFTLRDFFLRSQHDLTFPSEANMRLREASSLEARRLEKLRYSNSSSSGQSSSNSN